VFEIIIKWQQEKSGRNGLYAGDSVNDIPVVLKMAFTSRMLFTFYIRYIHQTVGNDEVQTGQNKRILLPVGLFAISLFCVP